MASRHEVRILVADQEFFNATQWSIESDIMQSADAFSITVANPYGGSSSKVATHDAVKVLVDETVQMTGWIDDLNLRGGADSGASIEIVGRDRFGQLVDVSATPKSYANKDLSQIAKELSDPFVTTWHVDNEANRLALVRAKRKHRTAKKQKEAYDRYARDTELLRLALEPVAATRAADKKRLTKAKANLARIKAVLFPRIKVSPGESPMEVIERAADKTGMMVWCAADGAGIIARPNYDQAPLYQLQLHPSTMQTATANNVKSWDHQLSGRELFATYRLSGTSANTANANAAQSHHDIDDTDSNVALARHKLIVGSGQNKAQSKNQLVKDKQLRQFNATVLNYTVQGHGQGGLLWEVDTLVSVDDRVNGIQGDYYLTRRRFVGSKQGGQETELTLHQKGILLP